MTSWASDYEHGNLEGPPENNILGKMQSSALDNDDDDAMNISTSSVPPESDTTTARELPPVPENRTPLEQLMQHWMNERHAPDILAAQEVLLGTLLDHIRRQSDTIQMLRGDPSSSEEEHIRIMLAQTEVERVKFVVRSYVRTRLYKIEKYARFIVTDAVTQSKITTAERLELDRHAQLTDRHLYVSVLQSLPTSQANLDDNVAFIPSMITPPDLKRFVFVRVLRDDVSCQLPDNKTTLRLKKGEIKMVAYYCIEALLTRGDVELV